MTDLMKDVIASPEDDEPRLVFADALMEEGDPRGELIQVQCHLARGTGDTVKLRRWEAELMPAATTRWKKALAIPAATECVIRRGFVESVAAPAARFEPVLAKLAARTPLRGLLLTGGGPEQAQAIAASKVVAGWTELGLHEITLGPKAVAALAASPHVGEVRRLSLRKNGLGPAAARVLFGGGAFRSVEELHVAENGLHTDGMRALVTGPSAKRLRVLSFESINTHAGWHEIVRATALSGLRELTVVGVGYDESGMFVPQALAAAKHMTELERLALRNVRTETAGVRALAKAKHLKRLAALDLRGNRVGPQAMKDLGTAAWAGALRSLDLRENKIGDAGARALCDSAQLGRLEELRVGDNGITERGWTALRERFGPALIEDAPAKKAARKRGA